MPSYLLDVNILIALLFDSHAHHVRATTWFNATDREWRLCCFTESGLLRYATGIHPDQLTSVEATALLASFTRHPGYQYLPVDADWQTLCAALYARLQGTKQITDAYLLGLAVRNGLTLVTMDKGILHLAGPSHADHVLLLQ